MPSRASRMILGFVVVPVARLPPESRFQKTRHGKHSVSPCFRWFLHVMSAGAPVNAAFMALGFPNLGSGYRTTPLKVKGANRAHFKNFGLRVRVPRPGEKRWDGGEIITEA